jgi:hypothetical protein
MSRIVWLEVGISFGSLPKEYERVWSNLLFEPPPLHIFHEEEGNEESVYIRVEEEREGEGMSEEEVKFNNNSQIGESTSAPSNSQPWFQHVFQ